MHTPPPAQSADSLHSTHAPCPSQTPSVTCAQALPTASGEFEGAPILHVSLVQSFLSSSVSVASSSVVTVPMPSHTSRLQSPATCELVGPLGSLTLPHKPSVHVRFRQTVSVPGQSLAVWQFVPPPAPAIPPLPPMPPDPPLESIIERSIAVMTWHPVDAPSDVKSSARDAAANWLDFKRFHRFIRRPFPGA